MNSMHLPQISALINSPILTSRNSFANFSPRHRRLAKISASSSFSQSRRYRVRSYDKSNK